MSLISQIEQSNDSKEREEAVKLIMMFSVHYAVCTPVGLSRMFTVMGQLLVKPTGLHTI